MKKIFLLAMLFACFEIFAVSPSGSLPVIHINTVGNAPVNSKETYVTATWWLDPCGAEGVEAIGSAENPDTLQIRGRGNYTWSGFEKKPYRLKLQNKRALLGMKKSKHFGLLAHADDDLGFMRNTMGFELSRRLGFPYTPAQEPVELMLNGDYHGLYFLTELIRVDKDRVNINEQPDNITDPSLITGGWLVEIDNYEDPDQINITEGNGARLRVTYKTPEVLSTAQRDWLTNQFKAMDAAIYASDKSNAAWTEYIDLDRLARFYVLQEIVDNAESFHGSCYMHRDLGDQSKWMFGPVWDFGNSFHRGQDKFIHVDAPFGNTWIGEIYKFPQFREAVKSVWDEFQIHHLSSLKDVADAFAKQIAKAAASNYSRWPNYGNSNVEDRKESYMRKLMRKVDWLGKQWGTVGVDVVEEDSHPISISGDVVRCNGEVHVWTVDGLPVATERLSADEVRILAPRGLLIVKSGNKALKVKID